MAASSYQSASGSADRRTRLINSRDILEKLLKEADAKEAPALARELRATLSELDAITPSAAPANPLEELLASVEAGVGFDVGDDDDFHDR